MSFYCRCGSKATFDPDKQDLFPLDKEAVLFWVCDLCGKPSHVVQEEEPIMYAPPGALQVRDVRIRETGIAETTWSIGQGAHITTINYLPYPRRTHVDQGRDYLLTMWQMLDTEVEAIKTATHAQVQEYAKYRAGAIADIIFILMKSYYDDRQAVTREALKRYDAKLAGQEHVTPGLAEEIWNPEIRFEGTVFSRENEEKVRSGAKVSVLTGNRVPEAAMDTARNGIQMGMFTVKQMAETYKMTEEELKQQLGI